MTAVRKFMFEHDFDAEAEPSPAARPSAPSDDSPESAGDAAAEPAEPETPPMIYTEGDLEAARAESYQSGYDAGVQAGQRQGREAAETEASQAARAALSQVAQGLNQLFEGLDDTEARRERQALEIAMTIARRLFPALERRHGMAEVESLISRTMERLRETPRVVVRAHPDTVALLDERREALAAETGYEGRLKLVSDSQMGATDVSVTWSDGSAARDTAGVWAEVDAAIRNALEGVDEADIAAAQGHVTADGVTDASTTGTPGNHGQAHASGNQRTAAASSDDGDAASVTGSRTDDGATPAAAGSGA
jgi:flagellar assembly protein FliH